jgi:membrane protease YdiL (CAAX protease family)
MGKKNRKSQIFLFILISYAHLWLLYGIGKLLDIQFSYNPLQPGGVLVLLGVPASLIAAFAVTLITQGIEGPRRLFNRSLACRFSPIWYLAAVIIPVVVTTVSTVVAVFFTEAIVPERFFSTSFPIGLLTFFLIYDGLGEEIGWRGLALPQLQERLGSLGGNIVLGIAWALWHLPLFFMPGSSQYGSSLVQYVYLLTCWSIVIGLLVNRARGSVLVAILFHETVNFIAFTIHYPHTYVHIVWGVAALIAIVFLPKPLIKVPFKSAICSSSGT